MALEPWRVQCVPARLSLVPIATFLGFSFESATALFVIQVEAGLVRPASVADLGRIQRSSRER